MRDLRALFPRAGAEAGDKRGAGAAGLVAAPEALPAPPERSRVEVDESSATFERLAGGIAKYLSSAPNRAAPGPLGSRFEHWKVLKDSPAGLEAAARVLARLILGGAPVAVVDVHMGAVLYALPKPSGGVRPIACGSVLRRLAAGGLARAFREELTTAAGPHQFAVGRPGGAEVMQKAIAVAAEHRSSALVMKYDFKNAYNSLTRAAVREGIAHGTRTVPGAHAVQLPDVTPTLAAGVTTHWWVDAANEASDVRAERGVDQGCPLSPALFALAIGPALERLAGKLRQLDPDALVFAYLDDVVIHVAMQHADAAAGLVAAEFSPLGLELNADKTAVWSPDAGVRQLLLPAWQARWAYGMPVLGSAIPYVRASYPDPDDVDPAEEAPTTQRAIVALNGFQAELAQLHAVGLPTMVA